MRGRMLKFTVVIALVAAGIAAIQSPTTASADTPAAVRSGFDSQTFAGNDDGSTGVTLPFQVGFYGHSYTSAYLNNNGNITFNTPLGTYTPYPLSNQGPAIIAAFFADVDTRVGNTAKYGSGTVDGHQAWGATWPAVGCYNQINSVQNTFQLILISRSDIAPGNFDIEFDYNQIQWQAGTASGGDSQCLHGTPVRAGYASGSGDTGTYYELPGSGGDTAFLDSNTVTGLVHHSYGSSQLGRYVYQIRNGGAALTSGAPIEATGYGTGSTATHDPTCNILMPVNCASGNFWHTFTDISIAARGLTLTAKRTYNSQLGSMSGDFGYGWSWSYGYRLATNNDGSVTITADDGSQVTGQPIGGGQFVLPTWAASTLTQQTDGSWLFVQQKRLRSVFDPSGHLTSISDLNGETTTLTYQSGVLAKVTDSSGRAIVVTTDATNRITKLVDPMGRATTYGYDANGNLVSTSDSLGRTNSFTYDAAHQMLTMTDPRGGVVTNTYDANGRVTQQADPLGRVTHFAYTGDNYSAQGGSTTITDPNSNATIDRYTNGELVSTTKAAGTSQEATATFEYESQTLGLTKVTDPFGHVTTNTYDNAGNRLSSTDALNRTTTYTYDSLNNVTSVTSPMGRTGHYTYDLNGNPKSVVDPAGNATTFTYGDSAHPGDITSTTDRDGRVTTATYDAYGNVLTASSYPQTGVTNTAQFAYNLNGEQTCAVLPKAVAAGVTCPAAGQPAANTTSYVYDAAGQLLTITDPNGRVSTTAYDADGNVVSAKDANGHVTSATLDADNELTKTTRADGSTNTFTYDANGNRLTSVDAAGHITAYTYDALDNSLTATDPLGHVTTHGYDQMGRPKTVTNPDGKVATVTYDAAGQVTALNYSDSITSAVSYTYDNEGHRTSMADGTGTTTYTFDGLGRLAASTDGSGANTNYTYDNSGHVTSITYPNGNVVTKAYNGASQLSSITDWLGKQFTFGYDANGSLTGQSAPNGVTSTSTYDNANQLMGITDSKSGSAFAGFSYTRNESGQVTSAQNTGVSGDSNHNYSYTDINQLASDNSSTYGYDQADNLIKLASGATQAFNAGSQLTAQSAPQSNVVVDTTVSADSPTNGNGVTSPTLTTTGSNELVLALVSTDGPATSLQSVKSVSGAGLTWTLASRANGTPGTAEVWQAYATGPVSGAITASLTKGGYDASITVTAYKGAADHVGTTGENWSTTGAPAVTLTPIATGSVIVTAGHDWDQAAAVTPLAGQTMLHQFLSPHGDTMWAERVNAKTTKGTQVTVGEAYPNSHTTQFAAVEIPPASAVPTSVATDQVITKNVTTGSSTFVSSPVTTSSADELILAFISADGPGTGTQSISSVSGGGLSWSRASQANGALGTAEVWQAHATSKLSAVQVTASLASTGYKGAITVMTFTGAAPTLGTTASSSQTSGAPAVSLTPTTTGSLVFASGHIWHPAASVVPANGQSLVNEYQDEQVADTFWTQRNNVPTTSGLATQISDTAPTDDRSELAAVEVVPATQVTSTATLSASYGYNAEGDRTAITPVGATAAALSYDQTDHLTSYNVTGTAATYKYNGDGMRMAKTVNGTTTSFAWDLTSGMPMLLSDGATSYVYGPDGTPLEQITGTTPTYFLHDQNGSTRLLVDASGAVVGSYTYDAYGATVSHTGTASTALQYDGQYTDTETGFQYLRARFYDPVTAQFLTVDPLAAATGTPYSYAGGNPLNASDPSGAIPFPAYCGMAYIICQTTNMKFTPAAAEQYVYTTAGPGAEAQKYFMTPCGARFVDVYTPRNEQIIEVKTGSQSGSSILTQIRKDAALVAAGGGMSTGGVYTGVQSAKWEFYPNAAGVTSPSPSVIAALSGSGIATYVYFNGDYQSEPQPEPHPAPQPYQIPDWLYYGLLGLGGVLIAGGLLAGGAGVLGALGGGLAIGGLLSAFG